MALLSSSSTTPSHLSSLSSKPHHFTHKPHLLLLKKTHLSGLHIRASTTDNGPGAGAGAVTTEEKKVLETSSENGPPQKMEKSDEEEEQSVETLVDPLVKKFQDPKWVNGTWDLKMFTKDGTTNWDAVIDAEAKRRKWLETYPESTSNDEPIVFDTSIIPWWAWIKRFHLPEAEILNGRAAMVGFFMAYFVDSLTGLGVVDQMGNFFCKTLLFGAILGVLLIRKNEDVENLKKLFDETTFYDKQWQATWQDETKKD